MYLVQHGSGREQVLSKDLPSTNCLSLLTPAIRNGLQTSRKKIPGNQTNSQRKGSDPVISSSVTENLMEKNRASHT